MKSVVLEHFSTQICRLIFKRLFIFKLHKFKINQKAVKVQYIPVYHNIISPWWKIVLTVKQQYQDECETCHSPVMEGHNQ